jgi:hypothetical protein
VKVGSWADSSLRASRSVEQAISLLRAIPGGPRISNPIRYAGASPIQGAFSNEEINRRIAAAPVRKVAIQSLVTGQQHTVSRGRVESYIRKPDLIPKGAHHPDHGGPIDYPIVIRFQGKRWAWDGHHRIMAATLSGARLIKARYVDLDEVSTDRGAG